MTTDNETIERMASTYASRYTDTQQRAAARMGFISGYQLAEQQEETAEIRNGRLYLRFDTPKGQPVTFHDLYLQKIEIDGRCDGYKRRAMW